jgi:phosphonate transport system substrate-binding protein
VNLDKREVVDIAEKEKLSPDKKTLRIAVGSMLTSREGYVYYKRFADYVARKLDQNVELVDRGDYTQINNLLKSNDVDVAIICERPYVETHDEFGVELLVAPEIIGEFEYRSYIIVPADSPVSSLDGLRGKRFAFTDPLSNTGKLVPDYLLYKMNETPESFFGKYVFTYAHDRSIEAVAYHLVDGAAVNSLVWGYYNQIKPEITSKTRIIFRSQPYGTPPVVIPSNIDNDTRDRLRGILLGMHEDKEGQKILKGMMIDRFITVEDDHYNSIRKMIAQVESGNKK